MSKLPLSFYRQTDVVALAKALLGKRLCTKVNGVLTTGIISETEAYKGTVDKACHAYGGRRTKRTETMYAAGGLAYIYICYGIHHLFNVVVNKKDIPEAILVRAMKPEKGIETMKQRRGKTKIDNTFSGGPGTLSQALGITTQLNGVSLCGDKIWIEETDIILTNSEIEASPRIGVGYAGEHALLPYRFVTNLDSFLH